jgi:hypothetical protein
MKKHLLLIATAVASAGAGGFAGYKYAERQLVRAFEERLDQEMLAMRRLYGVVKTERSEAVDAVLSDIEINKSTPPEVQVLLDEYAGEKSEPVAYHKIKTSNVKVDKKEKELFVRPVFQQDENRGPIYVVSLEEFNENEPSFQQETLTWYAGDETLTDAREDIIEDYLNIIGQHALSRFGDVSEDDNVVHVRNTVLMVDYEIVRSTGTYQEEVLGMEPEDLARPSGRSD